MSDLTTAQVAKAQAILHIRDRDSWTEFWEAIDDYLYKYKKGDRKVTDRVERYQSAFRAMMRYHGCFNLAHVPWLKIRAIINGARMDFGIHPDDLEYPEVFWKKLEGHQRKMGAVPVSNRNWEADEMLQNAFDVLVEYLGFPRYHGAYWMNVSVKRKLRARPEGNKSKPKEHRDPRIVEWAENRPPPSPNTHRQSSRNSGPYAPPPVERSARGYNTQTFAPGAPAASNTAYPPRQPPSTSGQYAPPPNVQQTAKGYNYNQSFAPEAYGTSNTGYPPRQPSSYNTPSANPNVQSARGYNTQTFEPSAPSASNTGYPSGKSPMNTGPSAPPNFPQTESEEDAAEYAQRVCSLRAWNTEVEGRRTKIANAEKVFGLPRTTPWDAIVKKGRQISLEYKKTYKGGDVMNDKLQELNVARTIMKEYRDSMDMPEGNIGF